MKYIFETYVTVNCRLTAAMCFKIIAIQKEILLLQLQILLETNQVEQQEINFVA